MAGEEKCPPFGLKYGGIWHRPGVLEEREFYSFQEFHDLLAQAFISKSPSCEDVSEIYRTVMGGHRAGFNFTGSQFAGLGSERRI